MVMNENLKIIYYKMLALSVYNKILHKPITQNLMDILENIVCDKADNVCRLWGEMCSKLANEKHKNNITSAIEDETVKDENGYTEALAAGTSLKYTCKLAKHDLGVIQQFAHISCDDIVKFVTNAEIYDIIATLPKWETSEYTAVLNSENWARSEDQLSDFYSANGFGRFIDHHSFLWKNEQLVPVKHTDPITFDDLKGYEYQRSIVTDNTLALLKGKKANNILLYGDRGTGKSSTVKALLNKYSKSQLRIVEIVKSELWSLANLIEILGSSPMKFIVFIDDLSFEEDDDSFTALKGAIEGGVNSLPLNVVIYATSNRRHLIKESFHARAGDEIHHADTIQQSVSLSDRFGIVLTYFIPRKDEFLNMISQMAKDEGLDMPEDELFKHAEQWAIERGARSPRYARQFITHLLAKI